MNTPTNELIRVKLLKIAQANFDDGEYIVDGQDWRRFLDDATALITTSQIKMLNDLLTFTDVHGRIHFLISILEGQL